jgi:hypothetical protein
MILSVSIMSGAARAISPVADTKHPTIALTSVAITPPEKISAMHARPLITISTALFIFILC